MRKTAPISAALLALGLTACSGGADDGATTELVLQTNWTSAGTESKPLKDALASFTEKTGITVKVLENGDDLNQVYETSLLAGEEADVLLVGLLEKQLDWAKNGAVVDVADYVDEWGLTDAIPAAALADWTDSEGSLRGFPYAGFTWPWWYNTALLEEAGLEVPTTNDELIATTDRLRELGYGGIATGGNDWSGQKLFLQYIQTYMTPEETVKVFAEGRTCSSPAAMKGIEEFVRLRDAGVFVDGVEGLTSDQASALYLTGKALSSPMGSWAYQGTDAGIASTTYLGGMPVAPGSTATKPLAYNGSTSAGWWISPNGAKKLDAVRKLVEHMFSTDVMSSMVVGGTVMATDVTLDVSKVESPLLQQSFTDLPGRVQWAVMPDLHVPADVSNPMYRATSIAFTKGNDAKTVCAMVDETYDAAR
ncbi:ABC transporter substrate-binding protein [Sanguibacter sp. HDW7]|uniref:ABC transporter substrate-binding protein n=1 Tax=Sanguibacter sp. HDW7 TaxID=2714931 RepID=UPI001408D5F4|nr:ABC transporter substrate-binding protein [Sanguibacter sp. HDW7]QIK84461.1 carbohydrate ABC transporter substrate-binding protein [Sanguibacter sp. HDW7]